MTKVESTRMTAEIRQMALRLTEAGVPPALTGIEFMATGAGLLHQCFGADYVRRQCEAIALAVTEEGPKHH